MRRLKSAFFAFAMSTAAWANPEYLRPYIQQVERDGFTVERIYKSFFGRYVIVAYLEEYQREIVVDPHTGTLLRDRTYEQKDDRKTSATSGDYTGNKNYPSDDDDHDERDDDDEEDDDDD